MRIKEALAMLIAIVSHMYSAKRYDYQYSKEIILNKRVGDTIIEDHFLIEGESDIYYWRESKDIVDVENGFFIYGNIEYSKITSFGKDINVFISEFNGLCLGDDKELLMVRYNAIKELLSERRSSRIYYLSGDPFEVLEGRNLPNGISRYGCRYGVLEKYAYFETKGNSIDKAYDFKYIAPKVVDKNTNYVFILK